LLELVGRSYTILVHDAFSTYSEVRPLQVKSIWILKFLGIETSGYTR
jgi:hypothetical protein